MKNPIFIAFFILSPLVLAQEKEVWACQGENATGFIWKNESWASTVFEDRNILVTIDGANSVLKLDNHDFITECKYKNEAPGYWACFDGEFTLLLDPDTGRAGMSLLFGALIPDLDPVAVQLFQCTKF